MLEPLSRSARPADLLARPNGVNLLVGASLAGLAVISLYRFQHQLGPSYVALFSKEGPFEDLTFILAFLGSAWCAGAVWRFSRNAGRNPPRPLLYGYAGLAVALFGFGMEEINWGQTLLGFSTPEAWKAVNYQDETSLHNVLDRDELEVSARIIGVLLAIAVVGLVAVRMRWPSSLPAQIEAPAALIPLCLCVAYASLKQHSEVVELLLSIFFAFYGYRLWVLARLISPSASVPRPS